MIKAAASLAQFFGRIPKPVLFVAAILIQIALLAAMVFDRAGILREGREVTLQTRPVDPRDFLRGDYVVLGYDISQLKAGPLMGQPAGSRHPVVFVKPRSVDPGSRQVWRVLRRLGRTRLLRQASGPLQSRKLFRSRRRRQETRGRPQRR
jgi:hypothetical protein